MVDISKALGIHGWMSEDELKYLASVANKNRCIAEIGAWKGRTSVAIATNTDGELNTVDTWNGSDEAEHINELRQHGENWLYDEFMKNVDGLNVIPHRMTSLEAAEKFSKEGKVFDMIFIDASHDYENVKADILAWMPLLKEDGILCGHDYNQGWPGVIKAVEETVPKFKIAAGAIWTTEK